MAVNTTPKNSWVVYSASEQKQLMYPQYRLRSRYTQTKDPLPVMNYKQVESSLPPSYDIPVIKAPAGSADTSFSMNGYNLVSPGTSDIINSIVLQLDGKIIVGGYATISGASVFALARYNSNGSLDTTFGINGYNITTTPGTNDFITSIALQPDGKIVAGGKAVISARGVFALARYNSNGSLDTTFGINGYNVTATPGTNDAIDSVIIQSDGKIVVGGSATISSKSVFALARYNSNGSLDTTFGISGFNTATPGTNDAIYSVIIQSGGKIVAGGTATISSKSLLALARYNSNGSLDTTFGINGYNTTTPSSATPQSGIDTVIFQSDGKILAGSFVFTTAFVFSVSRYSSDGSIDTTFGTNGFSLVTPGTSDGINSIVIQPDGKIIAGSHAVINSHDHFAVGRYNFNGFLDTTFGNNGFNVTTPGTNDRIRSMVIRGDKLIAGGYATIGGRFCFALTQYNL